MQMSHHRYRAFTLVEILVVVTIIAMLSALLLVAVNSGRGAANTAKTAVKLKQISEWMNLWSGENNNNVLPSQFDYQLENTDSSPIEYRSHPGVESEEGWSQDDDDNPYDNIQRGVNEGTWTDILWTDNDLVTTLGFQNFGFDKTAVEDIYDDENALFGIWKNDSPDVFPDDKFIYDLYENFDNPFRSTFDNTRGPAMGMPGFFAANDFFDARSATDQDPFGEESSTIDRYYSYAQIHSPSRSLYLVDSVAGETISQTPPPWINDFGFDADGQIIDPTADTEGEVDFRYGGECMMLLLDGSMKSMTPWTERGPEATPSGGSDNSLYGKGIRVHQLDKRKSLP
jgi:prepilin-type N-terminal cleavage/methylation domain-containing protein